MLLSTFRFMAPLLGCAMTVLAQNRPIYWKECKPPLEGVQCARYKVHIDHSKPWGGMTTLGVIRVKSNNTKPKGHLVFNPGRPGLSGIDLLLSNLHNSSLPVMELLRDYHLIGLDPRGVGQSSPIKCDPELWNKRVPTMVQNEEEYTALAEHWKAVAESCGKLTGTLFDNLHTANVARDLDEVRKGVWEEKLNFVGLSYGTHIGYTYAAQFPIYTGRMVLDSVVDHTQNSVATIQSESTTFEKTLQQFFTWCQNDDSCSLHGEGNVEDFFKQLTAKALAEPIPAQKCNQTGKNACQSSVSLEEMMTSVQEHLVPGQSGWGSLADNLLAASKGDASSFSAPYFTNDTDPTGNWASLAFGCLDWDHARNFTDLRNVERMTSILSPITRGYTKSLGYYARCTSWPVNTINAQQSLKTSIRKAPPILLINSFWDPETSVHWAVSIREQIPRGVLVFRNGTGHTTYRTPGEVSKVVNSFILDGNVPADGTVYQS